MSERLGDARRAKARRIIDVTLTGELGSVLEELPLREFTANMLYLLDRGLLELRHVLPDMAV